VTEESTPGAGVMAFSCPICGMETMHTVAGHRSQVYAMACTVCHNGSLVSDEQMRRCRERWEEELKEIIAHLDFPGN
jgi:predicted RNA-binding Zn-ribbon protein involved in translation (DUF1610 family)